MLMNDKQAELAQLYDDLQMWREARRALSTGKSYQIGNCTLTRANMNEIRQAIVDIKNEISQLENDAQSYIKIVTAIPMR